MREEGGRNDARYYMSLKVGPRGLICHRGPEHAYAPLDMRGIVVDVRLYSRLGTVANKEIYAGKSLFVLQTDRMIGGYFFIYK